MDEKEWFQTQILPKLLTSGKIVQSDGPCNNNESPSITALNIDFIGSDKSFMLTTCYNVHVKYEVQGLQRELHLFVKKTPNLPSSMYEAINFSALFHNEIIAYKEILPAFFETTSCPTNLPLYYLSELQESFAMIVLEDFTHNGWHLYPKKVNFSLDALRMAVKYLAKFHGIGFVMSIHHEEKFNKLTGPLQESRYAAEDISHSVWGLTLKEGVKRTLKAARHYQPYVKEEFLLKLKNLLGDNYKYARCRVQPRKPFITLCHGDYLRNNLAFKLDAKGQAYDCMMFDLQTLRVSSPMSDLSILLSLSSYAAVRSKHFSELFECYVSQLKNTYERLSHRTMPEFLNNASLLTEYARFLPYSIGIAAAFLPNLVEPVQLSSQEFLSQQSHATEHDIIENAMLRGGEEVDCELAHQIKELYDLCSTLHIDLAENL